MPHKKITESKFGLVELSEEDWWLCSTCNMCVSRCPRGVAITDVIRAVRNITLDSIIRAVPASLRNAMGSLKNAGNPWGGAREERINWVKDLAIPSVNGETEILYFSCCTPAFDPKMGGVARATVNILKKTGAKFSILGNQENCCGESVRKAGNFSLFENLAGSNIKAIHESGVRKWSSLSPLLCYFQKRISLIGGRFYRDTLHPIPGTAPQRRPTYVQKFVSEECHHHVPVISDVTTGFMTNHVVSGKCPWHYPGRRDKCRGK